MPTSGHYSAALSRWIPAVQNVKRILPTVTPRQRIVRWARWGVANTAAIHYTEGPHRAHWLTRPRIAKQLPLYTDCSGFATFCYRQAGLPDPNGLDYKTLGYTGTLLDNAQHHHMILTDISKARPGDLIIYGPGTGAHVAIIVQAGRDPLTVSHGQESEPAYVRVSQDGRKPQRICQCLP